MLIQFFKNSQPATLIALPFLALACWMAAYLTFNGPVMHDGMPLATLFMDWTNSWPGYWKTTLGFGLLSFQAIYLNQVINYHEVLYKQTNLTGLWYILLMVMVPGGLYLQPVLVANTLFIFLLNKTLKLYKHDEPTGTIFDSTFIIGLSTLLFLPSIILLPVFFIGLSLLRPFSAREWLVGFTGLAVPFFMLWAVAYFQDGLKILEKQINDAFSYYSFQPTFSDNMAINISFGLLAVILVFALLKFRANIFKNVIRTRKYQRLIFIYLVAAGIGIAAGNPWSGPEYQLIVPPLTVIMAYYFLSSKRVWWTEGLTLLLILAIVYRYMNESGIVQ